MELIYRYGARPDFIQSETLLAAIRHGDVELIKLICSYYPLTTTINEYALRQGIGTKNPEIVRTLCRHEGGVNMNVSDSRINTLYAAAMTLNPEIIGMMIQRGAKLIENSKLSIFESMFSCYEEEYHDKTFGESKLRKLIKLLLCSGAQLCPTNTHFKNIVSDYQNLLSNHEPIENTKKSIKRQLIEQMEQLMEFIELTVMLQKISLSGSWILCSMGSCLFH